MDNEVRNKKTNPAITYGKVLAIFCVICAHCNSTGGIADPLADCASGLLQVLGTVGVGCFFFFSGALYAAEERVGLTIGKKLLYIGVPWLISTTGIYLMGALGTSSLGIKNWLLYLIGYQTYAYYITVLFFFFILFRFGFMRKKAVCLVCTGIWLLSVTLFYDKHIATPYLDPTNWIGYFALGVMVRQEKDAFDRFIKRILRFRAVIYLLFAAMAAVSMYTGSCGYWGIRNTLTVLPGCFSLMLAGTALSRRRYSRFTEAVGRNTLFVYLWHMPFAGISTRLLPAGFFGGIILMRPIVIFALFASAILILNLIPGRKTQTFFRVCLGFSHTKNDPERSASRAGAVGRTGAGQSDKDEV